MIRLIALAFLISVACRWIFGRWPWEYLATASPRKRSLDQARLLLGVGADASRSEIRGAHRRMTARLHPDRGGADSDMQDLNAARDLLLNATPERTE